MRLARVLLALMVSILGTVAVAAPAHAATATTQGSGGIYHCTSTAAHCTDAFASFDDNASVLLYCWRDDRMANGSDRWFFVRFNAGTEGYVHSSKIVNQDYVPGCSTIPRIHATQWAINKIGQTAYVGECLKFTRDAWNFAGVNLGSGSTPAAYWDNNDGHRQATRPPRGALVFWDGRPGYPEGHVAISLGGGYAVSTYERSIEPIHILSIAERNNTMGAYYLGWIMP